MTTDTFQRKLTAILSADVVGYSRLMGEDEEATVRTLNKYKEMIFGLIERHNGRLVDSPGDNVLAEFASVVDAVRCGVQIQEDLKANNEELPPNRRMQFRIGINTGDVIQDGDRIYGDGVNVAARIESLADPGGICISRTAYDQVKKKLNIDYKYLGEYEVKKIDEPVRVYRVRMELEAATPKAHGVSEVEKGPKTIAILPFVNMSSDLEQEYFVDGLSEELIISLTKIPDLLVTARTSSFSFKGTNKKVQEIANELGVNNILEGSVRKSGNALRIVAQLIRASDGFHLWSKTYDRELKDIFAVQEDIATAVSEELKVTLGIGKSLKQLGGTDNEEAYEYYLSAKGQLGTGNEDALSRALESINTSITLDPKFALAWAFKARIHNTLSIDSPTDRVALELDAGLSAAQKAIELETNLGAGYASMGLNKSFRGDFIEAELAFRKALQITNELTDENAVIHYNTVGYFKRGYELIEEARRNDPLNKGVRAYYIQCFALLDDMKRAEEEFEHGMALFEGDWRIGNILMTYLRLNPGQVVPRENVLDSGLVDDAAKKHLDSPEDGLAELHQIYSGYDNLDDNNLVDISMWAAYFGDPEFAMDSLEKAVGLDPSITDVSVIGMIWYPVMREVRQLPRFKKFVREIGLVDYWNEFGWPDVCRPLGDDDFECD